MTEPDPLPEPRLHFASRGKIRRPPQPKVRRGSPEERARGRKELARVFPSMGWDQERPAIWVAMGEAARGLVGKSTGEFVALLADEKDPARRERLVRALIDLAARRSR